MHQLRFNRVDPLATESPVARQDPECPSLEGTIQRVNYHTRELTVIAQSRPWHLVLSADSQLWFNGKLAPFRCFQPLDHVRVLYESWMFGLVVKALYVWADEPADTD